MDLQDPSIHSVFHENRWLLFHRPSQNRLAAAWWWEVCRPVFPAAPRHKHSGSRHWAATFTSQLPSVSLPSCFMAWRGAIVVQGPRLISVSSRGSDEICLTYRWLRTISDNNDKSQCYEQMYCDYTNPYPMSHFLILMFNHLVYYRAIQIIFLAKIKPHQAGCRGSSLCLRAKVTWKILANLCYQKRKKKFRVDVLLLKGFHSGILLISSSSSVLHILPV